MVGRGRFRDAVPRDAYVPHGLSPVVPTAQAKRSVAAILEECGFRDAAHVREVMQRVASAVRCPLCGRA